EIEPFMRSRGYELARQIGQMAGTQVVIYDMKGQEIGNSSPGLSSTDVQDTLSYALQNKTSYQISRQSIYYLSPIIISEEQVGIVQFYYSLEKEYEFYNTIKGLFISVGSVIFIFSFILGYIYFGRMTNVILGLKLAVENVKLGKYKEVPELHRRDELGDLRQGIYYMSNQIEQSMEAMTMEQQKLTLAVEKLRTLEHQQRQFIGNVTHEFKTPLTVIKAYVDLMEMYPKDENLVNDAKVNISKETGRLYDMVDKTLQLAALEKYEFELEKQVILVDELLNEICSRMDGKVQKQGLYLYVDTKPVSVYADRESLFQVFINLIDNAIKYNNPKGKIYVKNYIQNDMVCIEIQDTGIGIPKESRELVFEPFYTVDKTRSRQFGGTGLGLALVRQLLEKQQGSISIVDTKEAGTTFIIKLPLYR
ncbi:MAG: histidine kinase, partial [Clostridia bacterium]|nr:histidine kinase [Clostridia bacterium]